MKSNSSEQILILLRKQGRATAQALSIELGISKEGTRKHLLKLSESNLVIANTHIEGVGRPTTYYSLSEKAMTRFPNTHADISVQLLKSVKKLLGDNALDLLVNDREKGVFERYSQQTKGLITLEEILKVLTEIRSDEGYMAEWKKEGDIYYFIENHCPICQAAAECKGFCRSELRNFEKIIGSNYRIERVEYIIENDHRCVYKIEKIE